jgi:hypothetical protein
MSSFKKISAVFLAAVFLFSSLGFTISSMVCLKSGKGIVSLFAIEDCCAKKTPVSAAACCDDDHEEPSRNITYLKKGDCCDISNYSITLNDYQVSQKVSVDQVAVIQSLFISSHIINVSASEQELAFKTADLPPPFYGRTLLNFISILTI